MVDNVNLSVAERGDVVIDFSACQTGEKLFLVNRLIMQDDGAGPKAVMGPRPPTGAVKFLRYETLPAGQGDAVLCFEVGGEAPDPSRVPEHLRAGPILPAHISGPAKESVAELATRLNRRSFTLGVDEANGDTWTINGRPFDPSPAGDASLDFRVGFLDTPRSRLPTDRNIHDGEIWTFKNIEGSKWSHPLHIHLEEFRILYRDGNEPPPWERVKKDVLSLAPGEEVQVFLRFRDFLGKYPIHCHNVLHEDHEMMIRFDVVGDQ